MFINMFIKHKKLIVLDAFFYRQHQTNQQSNN